MKVQFKNNTSNITKLFALSTLCIALTACNSDSANTTSDSDTVSNSVPSVDAGIDQTVNAGDTVYLNASVEDDDDVSVTWSQSSGTAVTLTSSTTLTSEFTAPEVLADESLVFELSGHEFHGDTHRTASLCECVLEDRTVALSPLVPPNRHKALRSHASSPSS